VIAVPLSPAFLAACASDGCPCCAGGGLALGFGRAGAVCACVARCASCDAPIPTSDFDAGRPPQIDGEPTCATCRTERKAA
jgi:hypothetical protein